MRILLSRILNGCLLAAFACTLIVACFFGVAGVIHWVNDGLPSKEFSHNYHNDDYSINRHYSVCWEAFDLTKKAALWSLIPLSLFIFHSVFVSEDHRVIRALGGKN